MPPQAVVGGQGSKIGLATNKSNDGVDGTLGHLSYTKMGMSGSNTTTHTSSAVCQIRNTKVSRPSNEGRDRTHPCPGFYLRGLASVAPSTIFCLDISSLLGKMDSKSCWEADRGIKNRNKRGQQQQTPDEGGDERRIKLESHFHAAWPSHTPGDKQCHLLHTPEHTHKKMPCIKYFLKPYQIACMHQHAGVERGWRGGREEHTPFALKKHTIRSRDTRHTLAKYTFKKDQRPKKDMCRCALCPVLVKPLKRAEGKPHLEKVGHSGKARRHYEKDVRGQHHQLSGRPSTHIVGKEGRGFRACGV